MAEDKAAKRDFPKALFVRLEEPSDKAEPMLIYAERSVEEAMEGDDEQEIAEYKLVKIGKARKVIKLS